METGIWSPIKRRDKLINDKMWQMSSYKSHPIEIQLNFEKGYKFQRDERIALLIDTGLWYETLEMTGLPYVDCKLCQPHLLKLEMQFTLLSSIPANKLITHKWNPNET